MLKLVDTVKTTCTTHDLIKAFSIGWFNIYNVQPKKAQIAVIYAQNMLETGGTTYMWNFNIGNIKAVDVPGETIEYCMLKNVWEMVGGKKIVYQPPHPATWFRAFDSLADGVTYHFNFLRNNRYKIAWTAVEAGNPENFAHLLKQQGYYTASEADYIKAMRYHYNVFMNGPTFDAVQQELEDFYHGIAFPTEYEPLNFDTTDYVVDKKDKVTLTNSSSGFITTMVSRFKNIFNR